MTWTMFSNCLHFSYRNFLFAPCFEMLQKQQHCAWTLFWYNEPPWVSLVTYAIWVQSAQHLYCVETCMRHPVTSIRASECNQCLNTADAELCMWTLTTPIPSPKCSGSVILSKWWVRVLWNYQMFFREAKLEATTLQNMLASWLR